MATAMATAAGRVMDLSAIWTMAASDLRQRVRDKSVFVFGLVVPLALMFVFNLLFSGIGSADSLQPITVGVATAADDPVGQGLVTTLESIDSPQITVESRDGDGLAAAVEDPDDPVEMGIVVPDGLAGGQSGDATDVEVLTTGDAGLEAQVVTAITSGFVDRVAATTRAATAAGMAGVSPEQVGQVAEAVSSSAPVLTAEMVEGSDQQLSTQGYLVAGQTALFMFFTVGFGVIGYLAERDEGTLPRLQSMPIPQSAIIIAKTLVSFILGVVATGVLLGAGAMLFGVSFGNVVPIAVLVVATVSAATSLVVVIIKVVRTSEQAQIANSIIGIVLGMLGGAFFPIEGAGLLTTLADLTPPAAFIRGLGITNGGGGVADLGVPLATLGGFVLVAVAIGLVMPERELQS